MPNRDPVRPVPRTFRRGQAPDCHHLGMTDAELTVLVRGSVEAGPGSDSLLAIQPRPGQVVVQAHPTSNYVAVLTPALRRRIEATLREWVPGLREVKFDPHH
jgi:hypothetical protein